MGNRNRTARRNLLLKKRNNASVTAQHIAKPHSYEFCIVVLVKGLDDHLTDTLTCTHDISWVHRLIGRNHNKALHAAHSCRLGSLKGSEYIILHRLCRTVLHQRHMLMGCRMIYNIRAVF